MDNQNTKPSEGQEQTGSKVDKVDKKTPVDVEVLENPQKEEQERTRIKKALFLEWFPKSRLVISATCDKVGISREIFYQWRRDDHEFAMKVKELRNDILDKAEDILMEKVFLEKSESSVHFFMRSKHPEYRPRLKVDAPIGKSAEDIWDDEEQQETNDNQRTENPEVLPHPGQARANGQVQNESRPAVLLEPKNTAKPAPQSEAKGVKQNHRRRPTRRLHPENN